MKQLITIPFLATIIFSSCKKTSTEQPTTITGTKTITVNFNPTASYTFFRFSDSTIVSNSDSATNKWDFGLRFTTFIVNSNASGPGLAQVQLVNNTFDATLTAPTTGYAYDTTNTKKAIKDGSWYTYNTTTHAFTPTAGKVFIFKTANGTNYAKMELLSVDYAPFVGQTPTQLLYKFRYTYQANGTVTF